MIPLLSTSAAIAAPPTPPSKMAAPTVTDSPSPDSEGTFAAVFDLQNPGAQGEQTPTKDNENTDEPVPQSEVKLDVETDETLLALPVAEGDIKSVEPKTPNLTPSDELVADGPDTSTTVMPNPQIKTQADAGTSAATVPQSGQRPTFAQAMIEGRFAPGGSPAQTESSKPAVAQPAIATTQNSTPQQATPDPEMVAEMPLPKTGKAAADLANIAPESSAVVAKTAPITPNAGIARVEIIHPEINPKEGSKGDTRSAEIRRDLPVPTTSQGPPLAPTLAPVTATAPVVDSDILGALGTRAELPPESLFGITPNERAITAQQLQTVTAAPGTAGVETARHVAGQLAVSISGQNGGTTEIALSPQELGRVRLRMTAADQTITVHILAERPETSDLLRRHIDTLAQEFRSLGYDDIAFSFGGDDTAGQADTQSEAGSETGTETGIAAHDTDTAPPKTPTQRRIAQDTGLDLRL